MKTYKVCIATTKHPIDQQAFTDELKKHAKDAGFELKAILGRKGFGCYNLGLKLVGEKDPKSFVDGLTMALMPARWSYCTDEFEGFVYEDL